VPQARAGLLPNITGTVYRATLNQAIFRADRWFQLQAAKDVNEQAALELS